MFAIEKIRSYCQEIQKNERQMGRGVHFVRSVDISPSRFTFGGVLKFEI